MNSAGTDDRQILLEYSVGSTMIKMNNSRNPIHIEDDAKSMTHSIARGSRRGST